MTPALTAPGGQNCQRPLTSQRFPGKALAIRRASDRDASLRAVARYVAAGMFVHFVTIVPGHGHDRVREALAYEAWQYVRLSPARKNVRPHEVYFIVDRAFRMGRELFAK